MQYRKFIISIYDDGTQEAELNRFIRGHRVVKTDQQFVPSDGLWAFLVSYLDGEQNKTAQPASRGNAERFDPSKELNEEQMARYKVLAEIRLQLAHRDNVKAYLVFTNRELAEMAKCTSLTEESMLQINGIGESRMKAYGEEFVRLAAEAEMPNNEIQQVDEEGGSFD